MASFPKRMPTNSILKLITFPPPPTQFKPTFTPDNIRKAPAISLRNQARIRKTCKMAGLDPVTVVGLPPEPEKKPLRVKLPMGSKKIITQYER